MGFSRWPLLQAQSIADVREALEGDTVLDDAFHASRSTSGGRHPRTRVQELYALSAESFIAEYPEYAYVREAYRSYACTQHRRDSGPVTLHRAHTGGVAHCFFSNAPEDQHEKQADYLFTGQVEAFRRLPQKGAFLGEIYRAGIEGACVIPIASSAYAYGGGLWRKVWDEAPETPLPLYANVLEAAFAIRRGWVADEAAFLALAARYAWFDTFDIELEEDRDLLVRMFGDAGRSRDLDLLLQRIGIRPGMTVNVPGVGPTVLWTYIKERMTWVWLLGDRIVKQIALQGLQRYRQRAPKDNGVVPDTPEDAAARERAGQQLCYHFFAIHQMFTAPIFNARGGAMNASPEDTAIWYESLLPGSFLEAAEDALDEAYARFFLQVNAITTRLRLTKRVTLEKAEVLELIPMQRLPEVELAEMPMAMRLLVEAPTLVDAPLRSERERQPDVQRRIAEIYSARLGDRVAHAGATLVRRTLTTAMTPGWLDWAEPAVPEVRVQEGLRKVKIALGVREFFGSLAGAEAIAKREERTLFSQRAPTTKFYVWKQADAESTVAFVETSDGRLLTGKQGLGG